MPPTYLTTSGPGLRYPAPGASLPDYEAYIQSLATDVATKLTSNLVSVLPGSPYDGQVVALLADATNGVVWNLRYRAASASASAYKWEFIGGSDLVSDVETAEGPGTASYAALATAGPIVTLPTLPSGGDFDVQFGCQMTCLATVLSSFTNMGFQVNSAAVAAGDSVTATLLPVSGSVTSPVYQVISSVSRIRRKTALASAAVLTALYQSSGGSGAVFSSRWMSVRPVRVG
jgi:hypothetical protein